MRRCMPFLALYVFLLALVQIPIWLASVVPLVDYPNHLARMYILINIDQSVDLQRFYEIHWTLLPNLAMDLLVPAFASILPLEVAGKLFLGCTFFLISGGVLFLHYALYRQLSFWPFLVFLFLYNRIFLWGFLNYLFGVGLALFSLGLWLLLRGRSALFSTPLFMVLTLLIHLSHLVALGLYGLALMLYELRLMVQARTVDRNALRIIPQFMIPMAIFSLNHAGLAHEVRFGDPTTKLIAIAGWLRNYSLSLDLITGALIAGVILAGLSRGALSVHREMTWSLAGLILCFATIPVFLFNSETNRIGIAVMYLFLACTGLKSKRQSSRAVQGIVIGLMALLLVRLTVITLAWQGYDKSYIRCLKALDKIDPGKRLFTAVAYRGDWRPLPMPVEHLSSYAVIQRSAFVPGLFHYPSTPQPLLFTPPFDRAYLSGPEFVNGDSPQWSEVLSGYDYAMLFREQLLSSPVPTALVKIASGDECSLYRITPPSLKGRPD